MNPTRLSHVLGIDDAPFAREHRGDVLIVGAVYAGQRLDGVLSARIRRDGRNATDAIIEMVRRARFRAQLHALLLQGIAFGGFNVVDIHAVHAALRLPVIVVARRAPDLAAIERALRTRVRGGARKWRLIERAGPMQALAGVYVQCAGISLTQAGQLIRKLTIHSRLPEPLRTAHLIAGGVTTGESRHRA